MVQQHLSPFLLITRGIHRRLWQMRLQVQLNGTKTCVTVLYQRDLTARMIVNTRRPEMREITQKVFDQITRYNMVLKVDYLIVSNGLQHYCCRIGAGITAILFCRIYPSIKIYRRSYR